MVVERCTEVNPGTADCHRRIALKRGLVQYSTLRPPPSAHLKEYAEHYRYCTDARAFSSARASLLRDDLVCH